MRAFVFVSAALAALASPQAVSSQAGGAEHQAMTPVLPAVTTPPDPFLRSGGRIHLAFDLAVTTPPTPCIGSHGRIHIVYELGMTNFSSALVNIERVEVLGDGAVLQSLDTADVARRLQPAGMREAAGSLGKSTQALLFLNV